SWMRTYLTDEIGTPRLGAGLLTSRIWSIITAPTWGSVLPHELTMHKVTAPAARQAVAQHGEVTSKQTRRRRRTLQWAPPSMCRSPRCRSSPPRDDRPVALAHFTGRRRPGSGPLRYPQSKAAPAA